MVSIYYPAGFLALAVAIATTTTPRAERSSFKGAGLHSSSLANFREQSLYLMVVQFGHDNIDGTRFGI
jgi:hypothetical protein